MGKNVMTTEERLVKLGLKLPSPPEPFGMYVEAVQTGRIVNINALRQRWLPSWPPGLLFIDFDSGRQLRIAGDAALVAPVVTRQVRVRVRVRRTTLISDMPELRWPLVVPASPCSSCATGEASPEAQSPVPHPSTTTKEST
jgi:hypothetical protein